MSNTDKMDALLVTRDQSADGVNSITNQME